MLEVKHGHANPHTAHLVHGPRGGVRFPSGRGTGGKQGKQEQATRRGMTIATFVWVQVEGS